jgi:hypothetical protein
MPSDLLSLGYKILNMNIKYLRFLIPICSMGIVAFVYLGLGDMKVLPMIAVLFMAAGFNYALLKYLKGTQQEEDGNNQQKSGNSMKRLNLYEETVKIAKPLRMVGSILFMILMIMWLDIIEFEYESYFYLLVLTVLLTYVLLGVLFFNKQLKSQK